MKNIKLLIEYDGSKYCGWQKQPNGIAIQQCIEEAIYELTNEVIKVQGSGRTDARVHALSQVASFKTNSTIPAENFYKAINSRLDKSIRCISSEEVAEDFHPRYNAKKKHYRYLILNQEMESAFNYNRTTHIKKELDVRLMNEAAKFFVGEHDFKTFMASKSDVKSTTRTIYSCEVKKNKNLIQIDIIGNGFLYNMVRIIAGVLVEVGEKKIKPMEIIKIINAKNRNAAFKTLGPEGLYLYEVKYE